ncbi:MAG TPA: universal stress protein [Ferrovibrio sp.]|jgi:nucleotide-binding universal stress UspA family protein|uniref:universal stress protein n=1 Tax=Ferrovibrio sp. TaxID=1917215 RepID=UPI002ED51A6D
MTYSDILVHLTDDPRNGAKTDAALLLARKFNAHVTALYTLPPPQQLYYMGEYVPAELFQRQAQEARAKAQKAKAAFEAEAAKQGVTSDWLESERLPVDAVETFGRSFDLLVLGQPDPDPKDPAVVPAGVDVLPHELALRAGRPILTIPYAGQYPEIGRYIMVAWNGSKEATRALHDAMPFLTAAKQVVVFGINPEQEGGTPGAEIARHLARHGVKVEVANAVAQDIGPGEALLSAVADRGVDLLVMGAYGHSRLREMVFGGVTETVLRSMTVPVLLGN